MRYYLFQYNVSSGLKLKNGKKLFIKMKKTLIHLYGTLFFIQKNKRFTQNYLFIGYKLQHKNN